MSLEQKHARDTHLMETNYVRLRSIVKLLLVEGEPPFDFDEMVHDAEVAIDDIRDAWRSVKNSKEEYLKSYSQNP